MLRARFAYFKVFKVSSAFESAGLTQAAGHQVHFGIRNVILDENKKHL